MTDMRDDVRHLGMLWRSRCQDSPIAVHILLCYLASYLSILIDLLHSRSAALDALCILPCSYETLAHSILPVVRVGLSTTG